MTNLCRRCAGIAVLIISALCLVRSVSASVSYAQFFRVAFGDEVETAELIDVCRQSLSLYEYNYAACAVAADRAFETAVSLPSASARRDELMSISRELNEKGMALNRYDRRFHLRRVGFLGLDPATRGDALAAWQEYTDWEYWNPDNHFYLVAMHAYLGNLEQAEVELELTRGSVYYKQAEEIVDGARALARP